MIKLCNVTKKYKDKKHEKVALDSVSLELGNGIHALLGPNGAGKSTMMKLISCNISPNDGEILWSYEPEITNNNENDQTPAKISECETKDQTTTETSESRSVQISVETGEYETNINDDFQSIMEMGAEFRGILGYAPQQQGLYESISGYRFLQYMAVLKAIPRKEIDSEIRRVAANVNLLDVLDYRISSYSGGMKQRLLVAQAFLGDPKLLIFDEPTVGLDPNERVRMREYIHKMSKDKIVLIATHIVSDVESIADDVIIMKQGRIVEKDSKENLCRKYQTDDLENVYMHIFSEQERE